MWLLNENFIDSTDKKLKTYSIPNPSPMIPAPRKIPSIRSSLYALNWNPREKRLFIYNFIENPNPK